VHLTDAAYADLGGALAAMVGEAARRRTQSHGEDLPASFMMTSGQLSEVAGADRHQASITKGRPPDSSRQPGGAGGAGAAAASTLTEAL
jgi:hypothetical protein